VLTKEFMTTNVVTVSPTTTVEESYGYMKKHRIRHLPVVDRHGDLVGIVSDRNVRQALVTPSSNNQASSEVTVGEIMTENVFTVTPHTDIAEAASLIYFQKIGGLPVIDDEGRLIGIITAIDLLGLLIKMVNMIGISVRIDAIPGDDPKGFSKVSRIMAEHGGDIISVWMDGAENEKAERVYNFRLAACDTGPITSALDKAGYTVVAAG